MNRKQEIAIEMQVAMTVVDALLSSGYSLGVDDGEEITIDKSFDREAIKNSLFTTDEDRLLVYDKDGFKLGWVYLVWGNVYDLVSDYSMGLDAIMTPLLDKIEEGRIF